MKAVQMPHYHVKVKLKLCIEPTTKSRNATVSVSGITVFVSIRGMTG